MQERSECPAAESLVVERVQNELVPEIIGHTRRHRDKALAAHEMRNEELAQTARDPFGHL
jgi:hypothetical protein